MVSINRGVVFTRFSIDISVSFFVLERVSSIEEEPISRFSEINIHDNSVILNIILDSESISF
jgi:hypothetical protein